MMKFTKFFIASALILLFLGCEQASEPYKIEKEPFISSSYSFAVHPYKNAQATYDAYFPILTYIESKIPGLELHIETPRNYAHFEEKLITKRVDFALPNPYQTLLALDHNYTVIAKMAPDEDFRGIIVARKDVNLTSFADLKGKRVSFPAPTALAATLMPKWLMHQNGLDPEKDIASVYAGTQDSSILNAYIGTTTAGCTWPPPWKLWAASNPEKASKMEVVWQTSSLPNNSVVVQKTVPVEIQKAVAVVLAGMSKDSEGKRLLKNAGFDGFEKANESVYKPVDQFLKEYERKVGLPQMGDGK